MAQEGSGRLLPAYNILIFGSILHHSSTLGIILITFKFLLIFLLQLSKLNRSGKFNENQKDNVPTDKTANIDLAHGRFSAQEDRSDL